MTDPRRRTLLATMIPMLLVGAPARARAEPEWSADTHRRPVGDNEAEHAPASAERDALVAFAELRLAEGETAAAREALERAAGMAHAADTELALVRTQMQAGEYRQALAFCAHAAGAHPERPEGTALYAWLLHVGGQGRYAGQMLQQALQRRPGATALLAAQRQLKQVSPVPEGELAQGAARAAPYGWGVAPADGARIVGSAVVLDGGAGVLAPSASVAAGRSLWLRNGLGRTVKAVAVDDDAASGLALLQTTTPLDDARLECSHRLPFAGSPGCTIEYAAAGTAAAWPLLHAGFFGRLPRDAGWPLLGIEVPAGPHGGPVFDVQGRLVGLAVPSPDAPARLLPLAALPERWMPLLPPAASASGPKAALDEVYERGLRAALQLIAAA